MIINLLLLVWKRNIYSRYITPSKNVEIRGFIKHQSSLLINIIQASSFYAQFSRTAAQGVALMEAMLCGCIPLGTDVGDINILIKDIGFVAKNWNTTLYKKFILNNHNKKELRDKARKRIMANYTIKKREKLLTNIIS